MSDRCTCHDTLVVKNLNRWFKEKWVDVSRKDPKTGKHPPCGRSKAKLSGKGYPKCRPSVKVSSKTPKTSGSMSAGQKRAATRRKRAKKQGVGGKPTIVKMVAVVKSRELSPEARRHKLEYDKKYESSPERVKYREELNQERRRRGIYGSGDHKDVSHTQGGRLTLEGEHSNRARHFKNRGTLRVVKQQRYDVGDDAPCPACYGRGMLPEYADDEDEDPTCEACNGSGLMLDAMENSRFTRPRAGSSRDAIE